MQNPCVILIRRESDKGLSNLLGMRLSFNVWSKTGIVVAICSLMLDQLHKWWMLHVYDIANRGTVTITPFLDFTLVWNKGISYGLFQQNTDTGRYILIGITLVVASALVIWMLQARGFIFACAMGLVVGGAIGNVIDRVQYGAVADFFSLHAAGLRWYVFNVADIWVVAGVALLLYDSFFGKVPNE